MAKYFKLVEISQAEFVDAVGEDLDCLQMVDYRKDAAYIATADWEDELEISLYDFYDEEDT